jgi:glycerol-3-phosphate dehydrogenase
MTDYDLFIIGGGINGTGIARDAAGRGLRVGLAEMGDLAGATSSASTKLFHGGLRYLEFYKFRLVREALEEREVLLEAMPHISWPMRFVLPHHAKLRPWWLIRLGLFLYDNLGGRKILPATRTYRLAGRPEGAPLKPEFRQAFEYSDCWVEDSRLVVLNARDAALRGATVSTRTRVVSGQREEDHWRLTLDADGVRCEVTARAVVNAGGPWVEDVLKGVLKRNSAEKVRLVRGSHIVVPKLYDHDKCYFFQGGDGRIIFAIPYETDFTLIGTTDKVHEDLGTRPVCTDEERDYLCRFASEYFATPVTPGQVVWTYSGVRPLYDDGVSDATQAPRDYVLTLDTGGAPMLSVFGGKITTYRRLAEAALAKLTPLLPMGAAWTARVPLPGGDFPVGEVARLISDLRRDHPFLTERWARRLIRAYGTEAHRMLGGAQSAADLGRDFGATLTETEVRWLVTHEFARSAADIVWRRSKLGLRMTAEQIAALDDWVQETALAA